MNIPSTRNLLAAIILMTATILYGCQDSASRYVVVEGLALGTFVQVKCEPTITPAEVNEIIANIDREAKESMSIFDDSSLISKINSNKCDSLDRHIRFNIELAARYHELSNGYYDITIKPLSSAWGFVQKEEKLSEPNIDSLLEIVGFDKIRIDENRIVKSDSRIQLDLNSIAKGYVVDLVAEELMKQQCKPGQLPFGCRKARGLTHAATGC